jgi:PAS domain S-box-containing protein
MCSRLQSIRTGQTARNVRLLLLLSVISLIHWSAMAQTNTAPGRRNPPRRVDPVAQPLTNIVTLFHLPLSDAAHTNWVRFEGVITYLLNTNSLFVQDSSGGIMVYLNKKTFTNVAPGLPVQVYGAAQLGHYAPIITSAQLSPGSLPPVLPETRILSFDELVDDRNHACLVETVGQLRCAARILGPWSGVEMVSGQERIWVQTKATNTVRMPEHLLGAVVRIRGVCASVFNEQRQMRGVKIYTPFFEEMEVVKPATPPMPRTITSLAQYLPESLHVSRVLLKGTVLHSSGPPGDILHLRDDTGAIKVHLQPDVPPPSTGSRVEVVGYPTVGECSTFVDDATVRILDPGAAPEPLDLAADQVSPARHDAQLIRLRGQLLSQEQRPDGWLLTLHSGDTVFSAQTRAGGIPDSKAGLRDRSTVEVAGICQWLTDENQNPNRFKLLIRSPADIRMISPPPWWNFTRTATVLGSLTAVMGAVLVWGILLRRRAHDQTRTIREQHQRGLEMEKDCRDLYENTSDIIVDVNMEGRLMALNPSITKLTGFSPDEAMRMSYEDWMPDIVVSKYRELTAEAAAKRCPVRFEMEIRGRDKRRILLDVNITPAVHNGTVTGFIQIARDVTQRRRMEEKLRKTRDAIETANAESAVSNKQLELVNERLQQQIEERRKTEAVVERTRQELWESSRQSGMAEMATALLHNVGNVLNGVNVSSALVESRLRRSRLPNLVKVAGLLRQQPDLPSFLLHDDRGRRLPEYLDQLADYLAREESDLLNEFISLDRNLNHIRDIITLRQGDDTASAVHDSVIAADLMEDALRISLSAGAQQSIQLEKDFQKVPLFSVDRNKVLQVLVNLITNAAHACREAGTDPMRITLRVVPAPSGGIRMAVEDNGVGISAENLARICSYGFTTRKQGHGFGLFSSRNAARDMGGTLHIHSDGPGRGACSTLDLPLSPPAGHQPAEKAPG